MLRYTSDDEDSARWLGFRFRPGDIVISTRSKSGTTWMQMICALLVLRTPQLPAPLGELSPWLDWLVAPAEEVYAKLDAQHHRRFIKTHTPLDGVPLAPEAFYIVVGRHPLDMAVSLYHQIGNIDRVRQRQLTGAAPAPARELPPLDVWMSRWITADRDPVQQPDSLPGVLRHLSQAWRMQHAPNILLVHYDDLLTDLPGEMSRIAAWLGLEKPTDDLVRAATFAEMRGRADQLIPNANGVLKSSQAFFRSGRSRTGRESISPAELDRYHEIAAALAPADMLAWLHR